MKPLDTEIHANITMDSSKIVDQVLVKPTALVILNESIALTRVEENIFGPYIPPRTALDALTRMVRWSNVTPEWAIVVFFYISGLNLSFQFVVFV